MSKIFDYKKSLAVGLMAGCFVSGLWCGGVYVSQPESARSNGSLIDDMVNPCVVTAEILGNSAAPDNNPAHSAIFEVTAYCPCEKCCPGTADGVTASGHVIKPGDRFCAADKSIPFGTMIDIPGYGVVPVLDRGGAIKGNKIDCFFSTHAAALQFGRQRLIVTRTASQQRRTK